jgi:hypothetical protein
MDNQDQLAQDGKVSNAILPHGQKSLPLANSNRSGLTSDCSCGAQGKDNGIFLEAGKSNRAQKWGFGIIGNLSVYMIFPSYWFILQDLTSVPAFAEVLEFLS